MNDMSYINWPAMSDRSLAAHIGGFIRHHRLDQKRTQDELAHAAGISRSTLSLLERGETVTLATLLQVLRVLDQLQVLDAFTVRPVISPIAMMKAAKYARQRARPTASEKGQKNAGSSKPSDW